MEDQIKQAIDAMNEKFLKYDRYIECVALYRDDTNTGSPRSVVGWKSMMSFGGFDYCYCEDIIPILTYDTSEYEHKFLKQLVEALENETNRFREFLKQYEQEKGL